jgi:hypothetical protein
MENSLAQNEKATHLCCRSMPIVICTYDSTPATQIIKSLMQYCRL